MIAVGEIPVELAQREQWVLYRLENRPGNPKATKVPYQVRSPRTRASTTNPATWSTVETALTALAGGNGAGIGFVFSPNDPFVGFDFDHCIAHGRIHGFVRGLLNTLRTYGEFSPSGTGIHAIAEGNLDRSRGNVAVGPWGGKIECYQQARFFTYTGAHVLGTPQRINGAQRQVDQIRRALLPATSPPPRPPAPQAPVLAGDLELLEVARRARNGAAFDQLWRGDWSAYPSQSEADLSLAGKLCFYTGGDADRIDRLFRSSGLIREKWDRRIGDTTYGARTIETAITSCSSYYRGLAA